MEINILGPASRFAYFGKHCNLLCMSMEALKVHQAGLLSEISKSCERLEAALQAELLTRKMFSPFPVSAFPQNTDL